MTGFAERLRRVLPGLWAGLMLALGAVAAPSLFALLERSQAGLVAGRLFKVEAQLSLVLFIALGLLERRRAALRVAGRRRHVRQRRPAAGAGRAVLHRARTLRTGPGPAPAWRAAS